MKILFIAADPTSFRLYKDSTYAMMSEAHKRGYEVFHCDAHELFSLNGTVYSDAKQIILHEIDEEKKYALSGTSQWFEVGNKSERALTEFDCVLMRQDPPFDIEYFYFTHLLSAASRQGAVIFNFPDALRDVPEKLSLLDFSHLAPPTLVSRDLVHIRSFHQEHGDIIIKPLDGMGGRGVFRVGPDGMNLSSIVETLGQFGQSALMVQTYLPEIALGDKRILIFAGEPIPYVLARLPQKGDIRANLAVGGKPVAANITPEEWRIAKEIGQTLWDKGLLIIGLDMIGLKVTEINVTSPTGFQEITQQTGFDVAACFFDHLLQVL